MGEKNIALINQIESSDSNQEIENDVIQSISEAQSILEYTKDTPLYNKFQKEYQELKEVIINSIKNDQQITQEELKIIKWELNNITTLESKINQKVAKKEQYQNSELNKLITHEIDESISLGIDEFENINELQEIYNISPNKLRKILESNLSDDNEFLSQERIEQIFIVLEKRKIIIENYTKDKKIELINKFDYVANILASNNITDEENQTNIDKNDLLTNNRLRAEIIIELRNHTNKLKEQLEDKYKQLNKSDKNKLKQEIKELQETINNNKNVIEILKQFEEIKEIEKIKERQKIETQKQIDLQEKQQNKEKENNKDVSNNSSERNDTKSNYQLNILWNKPTLLWNNNEVIEISEKEAKIVKNNPEAINNLVNFHNFFKELNLLSVWEYRHELMITIWDVNIDPNDSDSIKTEELRKFWNKLLNFINNIWKEEKDKTNIDLTTISEVNMELRNFSWEDWVFSNNATFNIEWEDRFAAYLRQYWIIWWAYFYTNKFRENLK
jgi:hypothetical protein